MNTIICGNISLKITEERKSRIKQSIIETQKQINREMDNYTEEHRDNESVARWKNHIKYLASLVS